MNKRMPVVAAAMLLAVPGVAIAQESRGSISGAVTDSTGDKLAAHWGPYLDGRRMRPEAFAALVASFK